MFSSIQHSTAQRSRPSSENTSRTKTTHTVEHVTIEDGGGGGGRRIPPPPPRVMDGQEQQQAEMDQVNSLRNTTEKIKIGD